MTKPAPTHADLEVMFEQMERHMRDVGPMTHKELATAEEDLWRSKFRGERRGEPNQLFGFVILRVQTYVVNRGDDLMSMRMLPGMTPTAPEGWEVGSSPIWNPGAVVAAFRSLRDDRPSEFAQAANDRDDARIEAWEAKSGRKAFNPTEISRGI